MTYSYIYQISHLLGGIILLCAFSLLSQRRLSAMIALYQIEAITLAAAALWQGFAQDAGNGSSNQIGIAAGCRAGG